MIMFTMFASVKLHKCAFRSTLILQTLFNAYFSDSERFSSSVVYPTTGDQ